MPGQGKIPLSTVPALVLAGGLGTRLRGITGGIPKPLVQVGGRPFLEILLGLLFSKGFRRFFISLGYKGELIRKALENSDLDISFLEEGDNLLGTGGALRHALDVFRPRALVINGDTYLDMDYDKFVEHHAIRAEQGNCLCSIAIFHVPDVSRYGKVVFEGDKLEGFTEKDESAGGPGWINAGAYLLEREFVEGIREGEKVSLEKEVIPGFLAQGARISVFKASGTFQDIGTPESLEFFRRSFSEVL